MADNIKGLISAVTTFLLMGVLAPYVVQYFRPLAERFITLPPSQEIWVVFLLFGAIFGCVEFLQSAYVKGDFPWLVGRIGSGVASLGFISYIFFYMLGSSSVSSEGVEAAGMILLVSVSIGLSYLHLFLDFYDARSSRPAKKLEA